QIDAEQMQRAALHLLHPGDAADGHDEGADRAEHRPGARLDDVIIVILGVGVCHCHPPVLVSSACSAGAEATGPSPRNGKNVYESVISFMFFNSGTSTMAGSTKNTTGISST